MPVKILVADDSATIQKVIKIAFSKYPVEVLEARSLYEAMKIAKQLQPSLLIVDANLPGIQMPSDFHTLQGQTLSAALLILAGSYEFVDEESLKKSGLQHFLKKPFDTSDLITYVTDILNISLTDAQSKLPTIPPQKINPFEPVELPRGQLSQTVQKTMPPLPHIDQGQELPFVDMRARGKRAFDQIDDTKELNIENPVDSKQTKESFAFTKEQMSQIAAPLIKSELKVLVEEAVKNYCKEHFPELAKDILIQELRRLADEKTKYLSEQ